MKPSPRFTVPLAVLTSFFLVSHATATGPPMEYVGSLNPFEDALYSAVVVDTDRHVAYMGAAFTSQGVAVIDIHDRANPVLVNVLQNPPPNDQDNQTSPSDVDLVGRFLLVSYHPAFGRAAFRGVSVYDISADPYHPTHLRDIPVSACGLESSQLDPEAESGRPYAYCNAHCLVDPRVFIVNILTGAVEGSFVGPEPFGCPPFPCAEENAPHEAMVQRHPRSGRVLDYIGYWDSGLRIVDVTDPAHPTEVGAFDYGPGTPNRNAHGAVVTPSANWVYVGDELSFDERGGIHLFDASACDGTVHCTPIQVGFWQAGGSTQAPPDNAFVQFLHFDVHNMFPLGENGLLVANYGLGIRLLDVTNKSDPEEISFYLPNNNGGETEGGPPFVAGRRTYSAVRGKDGLIYASDLNLGFFVVRLNAHTVLPAAAFARGSVAGDEASAVRVTSGRGEPAVLFSTRKEGRSILTVYDVLGRRVATIDGGTRAAGAQRLAWDARTLGGSRAASGVYLARLLTPDGAHTLKLLRLAK